jgi:peptide deformylase
MYHFQGIGLAAVQVGVLKKVIVVDVKWRNPDEGEAQQGEPMCLINAEVLWDNDDLSVYNEGCLSFPDQYSEVGRPKEVRIRYMDLEGKSHDVHISGLLATCIQHEIDHTNGITFVDHLSSVKRDIILRKMVKGKKMGTFHHFEHIHVHGEHCDH